MYLRIVTIFVPFQDHHIDKRFENHGESRTTSIEIAQLSPISILFSLILADLIKVLQEVTR